jgi:DNA polymerase-4
MSVRNASKGNARQARTVALKLETKEFSSLTRSLTPRTPISTSESLTKTALALRERVDLPPEQLFRLVGVGLNSFQFEEDATDGAATQDLLEPVAELLFQAQQ